VGTSPIVFWVKKLGQIAIAIPVNNGGKISGQPEKSFEKFNAVTTRDGKSTHDPPNPNNKTRKAKEHTKRSRRRGNDTARLHRHKLLAVSHKKLKASHG
jgi:hypothetical protein